MSILINSILKNWKTTAAAIGMLLVAVGPVISALADGDPSTQPNWNLFLPEILAAIGLLFSRDANKSSQDSGIR